MTEPLVTPVDSDVDLRVPAERRELRPSPWPVLAAISAEAGRHLVYVVETADGQEFLKPAEFEKKYGWTNDPEKVRLTNQ